MKRLANLALLWDQENVEKSDTPFEVWITSRDSSFKQRHLIPHLIPDDVTLLRYEAFEEFATAREQLIRQRLKLMFAPVHLAAG